jgi:hypothetical protein
MKIALATPSIRPDRLGHVGKWIEDQGFDVKRLFAEKEPNYAWAEKIRKWWLDTGADFCLTLQDDSETPEHFTRILRAQLQHLPERGVLGLASVHPIQTEMYRQGHRWFRTRAWVCGWGWGLWRADLLKLQAWCDANEDKVRSINEDSLINEWCIASDRDAYHPCPSVVDHDTSLDSTYSNDHHVHRRPFITWRDTDADLTNPEYWRTQGTIPMLRYRPRDIAGGASCSRRCGVQDRGGALPEVPRDHGDGSDRAAMATVNLLRGRVAIRPDEATSEVLILPTRNSGDRANTRTGVVIAMGPPALTPVRWDGDKWVGGAECPPGFKVGDRVAYRFGQIDTALPGEPRVAWCAQEEIEGVFDE